MEDCQDISHIRQTVFVEEQGFSQEFDEIDSYARYLLVTLDGIAAATVRYFETEREKTRDGKSSYTLGRIAVLKEYRGLGLGYYAVQAVIEHLKSRGVKRFELGAQLSAKGFYEKLGFVPQGEVYYDEHCPHIHMVLENEKRETA